MKYLSSLFITLLCLYLSGCKDSGTQVSGQGNPKYPTRLNYEWEYKSITTISHYNKSGGIDSTTEEQPNYSVLRIIKTNDSLKNYNGLIEFEYCDKLNPENISYDWYLNSDTSFLAIAYYNPSSNFIHPETNVTNRYLTLAEYRRMISSILPELQIPQKGLSGDTIQFYDIPRKVLVYPISIGNTWVELYTPFYRERYVNNYLNIISEGEQFNCYEVKVKWPGWRMDINDYISMDAGLIKRDIISDSILITSEDSPDILGYGKIRTTSTLIRRNF
jgi:hypothetical protein